MTPGIVTFGKWKGHAYPCLGEDRQYVSWLLAQDWMPALYPDLFAYISGLGIPAKRYCSALTRDGNLCMFWALPEFGNVCRRHFNRDSADDFTAWAGELAAV